MVKLASIAMLAACAAETASSTTPSSPTTTALACPTDFQSANGTPCATEGQSCGTGSSTGFSWSLHCTAGKWVALEVPPPPQGTGAITCGDKSCGADQICIETSSGQGAQPPPGTVYPSTLSYACESTPQTGTGYTCSAPHDHHQSCTALIPAAPPRR